MSRFFSWVAAAILYACVATVLAQVVAVGMLWFKGYLTEDRTFRVLAAAHGIDMGKLREKAEETSQARFHEDPSYEKTVETYMRRSLDFDMREMAIDKGLLDLSNLQASLQVEHARFLNIKTEYDDKLQQLANESKDSALQSLQQTLEAMDPKQAKSQLVRMFQEGAANEVVKILMDMPTDKQKKIIAEFRSAEDSDQLHEILTRLRLGEPTVSVVDQARSDLGSINPANTQP